MVFDKGTTALDRLEKATDPKMIENAGKLMVRDVCEKRLLNFLNDTEEIMLDA